MAKVIRLELSLEGMEMIQVSVRERLEIWEATKEFLDGCEVKSLIEECNDREEAVWMIGR